MHFKQRTAISYDLKTTGPASGSNTYASPPICREKEVVEIPILSSNLCKHVLRKALWLSILKSILLEFVRI
ncbi:hypothetical protein L2E82_08210 [Cichorium intybus]|uniref:Uncharacterized protein n=1 Tax=Cichorium intybus TaxID=13427 RepID=A0ACB9G6Y7_CICIN|nr:hypothetical protein L2E82_08210 [Cichorium intybus]